MTLTLNEIRPIGLCITTQELFDTKRFLYNYCDNIILRGKDIQLKNNLVEVKRELNSLSTQPRFLKGYKAIITSNIEKILCLVRSRYDRQQPDKVRIIENAGNEMIKKVLSSNSFENILALESEFKSKITLPTYELFLSDLKKSKVNII
jgi:hypothetical protein